MDDPGSSLPPNSLKRFIRRFPVLTDDCILISPLWLYVFLCNLSYSSGDASGVNQIDVLFTDIGLRDDPQAGLELAKQAVERRPELKVLYATGQTLTDGMKELFVSGSTFLQKPYSVEELRTALSDLLM